MTSIIIVAKATLFIFLSLSFHFPLLTARTFIKVETGIRPGWIKRLTISIIFVYFRPCFNAICKVWQWYHEGGKEHPARFGEKKRTTNIIFYVILDPVLAQFVNFDKRSLGTYKTRTEERQENLEASHAALVRLEERLIDLWKELGYIFKSNIFLKSINIISQILSSSAPSTPCALLDSLKSSRWETLVYLFSCIHKVLVYVWLRWVSTPTSCKVWPSPWPGSERSPPRWPASAGRSGSGSSQMFNCLNIMHVKTRRR